MTPVTGTQEHLDAIAHLKANDQPLDDANAYVAAVEATSFRRMLRDAGGYADAEDGTVTEQVLATRQLEILAEDGYLAGDSRIPEGAQRQALAQAVREIGPVGAVRRDAEAVALARRERVVDEGITARKIPNAQREYWVEAIKGAPGLENALREMPANPTLVEFSQVSPDGAVVLADDVSLALHVRAEAWLEETGRATRTPITGELEYDEKAYMAGVQHARTRMVVEATKADLKARGVKEADWKDADGRESTVYADARELAELRIDGRLR